MKTGTRNDSQNDADVLLDLGEYEPVQAGVDDDFVLELDDDSGEVATPAYVATPVRTFVEPEVKEAVATASGYESYRPQVHSSFADTQEVSYASEAQDGEVVAPEREPVFAEPEPVAASVAPSTSFSSDQLTPEMIDAIARRVVEMMSDKVVREVAWEVVPDLAELLIKQQLERQAK